jgi:hypothetical protein
VATFPAPPSSSTFPRTVGDQHHASPHSDEYLTTCSPCLSAPTRPLYGPQDGVDVHTEMRRRWARPYAICARILSSHAGMLCVTGQVPWEMSLLRGLRSRARFGGHVRFGRRVKSCHATSRDEGRAPIFILASLGVDPDKTVGHQILNDSMCAWPLPGKV